MMNKKEQAEFDALKQQVRLAKALSWTQPVPPDVPAPLSSERGNRLIKGFLYSAYAGFGGDAVSPACSDSIHHNSRSDSQTSTKGSRSLYSTRLLALQALRHKVEQECAARLAAIDAKIEQESPTPAATVRH